METDDWKTDTITDYQIRNFRHLEPESGRWDEQFDMEELYLDKYNYIQKIFYTD